MAKLSVAIASYNGARHIGEQLRSIAAQTTPVDEVVVADDCSTDGTRGVVEAFARDAPFPVRTVWHPRNVGILENFYSAFAATSGEVIFYCDQDDAWRPDKVAKVSAAFEPGVAMVAHGSRITDGDLVPTGRVEPGNPRHGRLRHPVDTSSVRMWGHQAAFRRDVLDVMAGVHALRDPALQPFTGCFDHLIGFYASLLGDLVLLPDALTLFRRHDGTTTDAGAASSAGVVATGRRQQALRAVEFDAGEARALRALLDAAERTGLVDAARTALLRDRYARKLAIAGRQQALAGAGAAARLPRAAAAAAAGLRGSGFTNYRRGRGLAITALLGLGG